MAEEASTFVLEEVVAKEPDAISAEEKTFLEQNKDQLTTTEASRFGFAVDPIKPPEVAAPVAPAAGDDDGIDDDIKKVVSKAVEPYVQTVAEQQRTLEVNAFMGQHPELAPYRASIEEFKKHPTYAGLPLDQIAAIITAPDMQKIGARKEREAQRRSQETNTGAGNGTRPNGDQTKDWRTAPAEDYWAKRAEIMGHPGL